jgi:hypothetical protein
MLRKIAPLVLLVSFTQVRAEEKLDIGPCFDSPSDRKVSEDGRRKAIAYLGRVAEDKGAARAVELVCPQQLLRQASKLQKTAENIRIDGTDEDWAGVPVAVEDPRDNVIVIDKDKPADPAAAGMDLAEISYVCTDNDLYLRFKAYAKPQQDDTYYSLQIYRDGEAIASVALNATQAFVQVFNEGKVQKSEAVPREKFEVAIKDVVEARIARSVFPRLPSVFNASGASFNTKQNRANYTKQFKVRPVVSAAATTPAYLLARYAEKADLARAGLVPLALCLTESVIYANVEEAVRERVIDDGLAMLAASREVAELPDGLPFEAVLAWSNRALTWGGLMGQYLDRRGLITAEAYEFMCLDPRILKEVRRHLLQAGIGKQRKPPEVADAVDKWALSKNRYRWKLDVLEEWARTQPRKEYWTRIFKEASEDVKAGRDKVCTVNGKQIDFTVVMSPNLDWSLYQKNGYYFGPCGDVAVMSMLAYKSLGMPDTCFFWRFGKEDAQVHTFAGYYDRTAKVWRSPESPPESMKVKGTSVLVWSLPPLTDTLPTYTMTDLGGGAETAVSERSPVLRMSLQEMRKKLSEGFAPSEFSKLVYAQVEAGR